MNRRFLLLGVAALASASLLAAPVGPATAGRGAFVMSRNTVASGSIIVELDNQGEDPHNLNIAPVGSSGPPLVHFDDTASLQRSQKSFSLAPGTYDLWCDLPEHEALGMHATLTVSSP